MVDAFVDTEWALRDYLRAELPARKVWFAEPPGKPTFPMIVITGRIGGPLAAYAPTDTPRISFSVWGGPGGDGRHAAVLATQDLTRVLWEIENVALNAEVFCYGATVDSIIWAPDASDSDNPLPRYIVDVTLAVRPI